MAPYDPQAEGEQYSYVYDYEYERPEPRMGGCAWLLCFAALCAIAGMIFA